MANEEFEIKRRVWAYVLTGLAAVIAAAGSAVAFVYALYGAGAAAAAISVLLLLCLAGEIVQDNYCQKCEELFSARKFDEEFAYLGKIKGNHLLFPFMRERFYIIAIRNALARDDLALARSYIARLRHVDARYRYGEEKGIKYKTAYAYILILLDEGKKDEARTEYEDFRINNEHYAIYKPQIEVLNALFARLFSKHDAPLPEAAVDSPYPVLKRILGRHFEENSAMSSEDWNE